MTKAIIPAKPADVTWTDDQWKAIWADGQDVLVAAAAGSGKTAVLVNRIINKLLEGHTNVDELLVVTFTKASAAEMRHRIAEALEGAIRKNPSSQHLRKQLNLMNKASISTLHSFCQEVVKKYYYEIDIDPGFRIADTTEAELLKDEMIDDLLEEQYGIEGNEDFFRLVDAFSSDRSDIELQNIIRSLHEFSSSHPYPEEWLDDMLAMYDVSTDSKIDDLPFMESLLFQVKLQIEAAKDCFKEAIALAELPEGPYDRKETLLADMALIEQMEVAGDKSWQEIYDVMETLQFVSLKRLKGDYDKDIDKELQALRNKGKKILTDLKGELFSRKPESYLKDMQEMRGYVAMLVELVKQFKNKFAAEKKERGLADFSDLEHFCLEILTERHEDKRILPSAVAGKYRQQFKEVLVDEYQDTNLVQETILNLVSKETESEGNMFMVGDVKQSIYRFRLAEPNLFLGKYTRYRRDGQEGGLRIDLNRNFRSRKEVLDGTNYLFKQIMGSTVGEINYDNDAELKKGAPYPEDEAFPIDIQFIDKENSSWEQDDTESSDGELLEKAQLEARLLARNVKQLIKEKRKITDLKTGVQRSITYRDIVILMRSMTWAAETMEEFKKQGIPIYGNLSSGYFEATEVAIMMSLLKIIDNPLQDIPLASVLRSPIVGLDEEELAKVKVAYPSDTFYQSVQEYCEAGEPAEDTALYRKVAGFYKNLAKWRDLAKQSSLSDLIWQLYRDTGFYDYVGGMPGGKQRQANLRALFDRSRKYEESSFRGLFRFLRFIERMQERGDDLGAARALSEQDDVVRIMTIHSSKGLEFPVVMVSGLSRPFNTMDLKKSYLLDKEFGFACRYTNPEKQITYPSLPQIAFKKKKQLESIAEEMRVLYVALTRAKEKLILIGTLPDKEKSMTSWKKAELLEGWQLQDYVRAQAKSYSDWIGPALVRHRDMQEAFGSGCSNPEVSMHPSCWRLTWVDAGSLEETAEEEDTEQSKEVMDLIKASKSIDITTDFDEEIRAQLNWKYRYPEAVSHMAKQTVTEMKRQVEVNERDNSLQLYEQKGGAKLYDRPAFMQEKKMTPAEKGTVMHMVMQQIDLKEPVTVESLEQLKLQLISKEFLRPDQMAAIHNEEILQFFRTDVAKRLRKARMIQREVPFNMAIPAREAYKDWQSDAEESVLVQGVIDCLFEDEEGYVLLDYKTDRITGRFQGGYEEAKAVLADRYRIQINTYARAIERIMNIRLHKKYLYFFDDGGHLMEM
ncbi:MAG: helicase-exonuclease AddAB subunit AddA [Bacillus sp. (in: firmicutes)]